MKKITLIVITLLPFLLYGQTSLKDIRQKSYQLFAFSVAASAVEQYIKQDSIPVDEFVNKIPAFTFHKDSVDLDLLPVGHFIFISVEGNEVVAGIIGVSGLIVYPVNNRHDIQLDVRTQDGMFVADAKVWVNDKPAKYKVDAKTYWLKQRKVETGLVKVFAAGDTTYIHLDAREDRVLPTWIQRWNNFKITKTGRVINYLPKKASSVFKRHRRYKQNNTSASGYVLFNQPKYKLTDTVRLKAYIVNRKWKQYRKKANVFLEYNAKGEFVQQLLATLSPVSRGSFIYSFPLSDTLFSDVRYNIVFKNKKGKEIISKRFSTEDYLLDEIGSYELRSTKENYYPGDSLQFYASAKDANGLSLLDGNATLILTAKSINNFYKDSIEVPDTLFKQEKPLATDRETTFSLSSNRLPVAQLAIQATIVFKNSNNELHEETKDINYSPGAKELIVTVHADSVFATYMVNGKAEQAEGSVKVTGDQIEKSVKVRFPARLKIDPLAEKYDFTLSNGKDTLNQNAEIISTYYLTFSRISRADTLGFILHNPFKVPVTFIILDGNSVIDAGKDDKAEIVWKTAAKNKHKMYTVKWQYTWGGEHQDGRDNIALLYKLLQVKVNSQGTIFPGQKDTVTIEVKDYQNRPASGVNLAVVAYNSQFKKDIQVREPPYLVKYKNKPGITSDRHETDNPYILKRYKLGNHRGWIKRLALDSMQFYKILFPEIHPYDVVTPIADFIPQLSIHVVKNGQPQQIHLLYVNRKLVYYNGVTDKMKYAFQTMQGYSQIGVRLFDKYLQLDSLYIQPFYKHDIVIDLDSLPAHASLKEVPSFWTRDERNIIENSIWQLDNNSRTNSGFIWQYNNVVKLNRASRHLVGPFNRLDSLHFYAPADFDLHFIFEPGYEYNLSKQVSRLEKKTIFPVNSPKVFLPGFPSPSLTLGDTIVSPPTISYSTASLPAPFIRLSTFFDYNPYSHTPGNGKLQFTVAKDTILKYVVLYSKDSSFTNLVVNENTRTIKNIRPGNYTLLLVNKQFETAEIRDLQIKPNQTLCLKTASYTYKKSNVLIDEMIRKSMVNEPRQTEVSSFKKEAEKTDLVLPEYESGNSAIKGKVIDAKGKNGIPGAAISLKGTRNGVSAKMDGSFSINNIKEGKYTIVISSVGYVAKEINVVVESGRPANVEVKLSMSSQNLQEVVVTTAFGTSKKTSVTGSIASVNGSELSDGFLSNALQGRAAGVSVPGADEVIRIRGMASVLKDNPPIYVIDGIIYNELPAHIKPGMIQSAEVLDDAAATAIYGARGASGAVIITTGSKTQRNKFSDNALWQPELFTNAEGKVSFEAVYPDNITGWQVYVLAMDKKRRMGKGMSFTKAYKPLMAQLNTPQFLIIDDSVQLIGKALNYTPDNYSIQSSLSIDGKLLSSKDTLLTGNASSVTPLAMTTSGTDTLHASFTLRTTTGFNDGEDRSIPVFKKGSEEANGSFYIMPNDTTLNFIPVQNGGSIEVYAQNNILDILLNELEHLKKYPYFCMEQIASKLKGLAMEKQIREMMKQPFKNEKEINILLKKLQDNQLFDGSWSWWEKGRPNLHITTYIIDALIAFRKNPLVETNLRNGLLFLQNQLSYLKRDELLVILSTMSTANHLMDYKPYLNKLPFDSLNQHQQWQWVKICQQQKLECNAQLQQLVSKQIKTMTGGLHWGIENYLWYNNTAATTVLAYTVLEKEKDYQKLLPGIIQYFLEKRQNGFWRNTVESASITSAILPYVFETNQNFTSPATIDLTGDTSVIINSFPYSTTLSSKTFNPITINKTGGGITYLTLYQKSWNDRPVPVTDKFEINTYFEKNGQKVIDIPAGEKVKMMVKVNALKDAEYVMIEIPVPAGCNYASKRQEGWMHKEFYKNKVVVFSERLQKGLHQFEIELEPRYKGSFMINPAKAELMYFPVFYGRNGMNKVQIK